MKRLIKSGATLSSNRAANRERSEDAIAEIRRLWQEGLESGPARDGSVVMARLKQRYINARTARRT